jgi:N-6 DNA Methylase/TaqI-like C-terminal specificity domain
MRRVNDLPDWYEEGLSVRERKRRGHFSTPPALVEQILDACGYTPDSPLNRLKVLDPACGSGNFLAACAHRFILSGLQQKLSPAQIITSVQQNLWGFDPDPVACFLAEMQVHTLLSSQFSTEPLPNLHIHQGDGLVLPWHDYHGIDLFLANPPYLAAKNTDLSGYHSARQRGQADSYLLFMSLALQIVRPDGWLALVLPDPVLARANATHERERLLSETTIHHLWHLAGVFSAQVGAVVIIAQKRVPHHLHQVHWIRGHWLRVQKQTILSLKQKETPAIDTMESTGVLSKSIALALLRNQPQSEFCYLLGHVQHPLIHRLRAHFALDTQITLQPLSERVQIRRGEELSKESYLLLKGPFENNECYPVLRGGSEVRPYVAPAGTYWLARAHIKKPLERYLSPKLLVVKSTGRLQATLDLQGHIALQTLYLLNLRSTLVPQHPSTKVEEAVQDELYFLLALLNSRLLKEYVYVLHTAYKWVQPQIEQHVLAHLPIPTGETVLRAAIIERAKLLAACSASPPVVELKDMWNSLYEQQEEAICALYAAALPEAFSPI